MKKTKKIIKKTKTWSRHHNAYRHNRTKNPSLYCNNATLSHFPMHISLKFTPQTHSLMHVTAIPTPSPFFKTTTHISLFHPLQHYHHHGRTKAVKPRLLYEKKKEIIPFHFAFCLCINPRTKNNQQC